MGSIKDHMTIYSIFIIAIVLCIIYYKKYIQNDTEHFNDGTYTGKTEFNNDQISNTSMLNAINEMMKALDIVFNRFSVIDPAISINNNETICDNWNTYNNNEFASSLNTCKIIEGSESNQPQCLNNNILTSCSNFFQDGTINKYSNIDIQTLKTNTMDKILADCKDLIIHIATQSAVIDSVLNLLIGKLDLEKQQMGFIKYNTANLDDKQKLIDKTTKEFEKDENEVNINKVNFSRILASNSSNDAKSSLYYNIIVGLLITIIVLGVLYILFSNIED